MNPRLREAAGTLCASGRQHGGQSRENLNVCDNGQQGKTCEAVRAGFKTFNKMLDKSYFSVETAVANQSGAMEADTISKNGRSSKSQTSRGNLFRNNLN